MFDLGRYLLAALSVITAGVASPLATTNCHTDSNPTVNNRLPFTFAPLLGGDQPRGGLINDSYIVVLKPTVHVQNHVNFMQAVQEEHPLLADGAGIQHVYDGPISGYAGRFSQTLIQRLRGMPEVDYIEHDRVVYTVDSDVDMATQKGAPWGLTRVSHRDKISFRTYGKYRYDTRGGEGVDVYVIDSGINVRHVEFEGRASWGATIVQNDVDEDENGHGTHCAGTIASRKYGVAKAANVIAVKVMRADGYGSMSDIIKGITYAVSSAAAKAAAAQKEYAATGHTSYKGSVVNMSLGSRDVSRALNQALNAAVDQGIHIAVAAGNYNEDACASSPGSAEKVITVGASTQSDERAYFSNHGPCVDVFAPGLNVLSTFKGRDDATATLSGTSMASPHTAGLVAYLLGIYPSATFDPVFSHYLLPPALQPQRTFSAPSRIYTILRAVLPRSIAGLLPDLWVPDSATGPRTLSPAEMKAALLALATKGKLSVLPANTPNLLIFNNATSSSV